MKHLVTSLLFLLTISVYAQKNSLLERSFWKSNPSLAIVQEEVRKGNNPSESNSNAFDPTVLAINEGASNEVIKYLLNQPGNDVNKITHDQRTYIFWSAYKGNVELMDYLKSKGAKTNLYDSKGYSILTFAASAGQANTKVYDFCIKAGINPKNDFDTEGANALLLVAPFDKDLTIIDYFVSKGLDIKSVDSKGNTAFNYAAKGGNIPTLKNLIAKDVKYNDNAMIMASSGTRGTSNTLEVYQYLESLNIKPTAIGQNGENVLHNLVRKDKQGDLINYFISKGVNVNLQDNEGNTPFMNAASVNKDVQIITLLLSKVKDINAKNSKGVTALAFAVKNNSPEIIKYLIDKGADITAVDNAGENLASYLFQSYELAKKDIFDEKLNLLEQKGFDFKKTQKNGNTLYHLAVSKNDVTLLHTIERFKANVNAKNEDGNTALHKAAMVAQNTEVLKYLIGIGAKKDIKTNFKETAYNLAVENEFLTKNKVDISFLKS